MISVNSIINFISINCILLSLGGILYFINNLITNNILNFVISFFTTIGYNYYLLFLLNYSLSQKEDINKDIRKIRYPKG